MFYGLLKNTFSIEQMTSWVSFPAGKTSLLNQESPAVCDPQIHASPDQAWPSSGIPSCPCHWVWVPQIMVHQKWMFYVKCWLVFETAHPFLVWLSQMIHDCNCDSMTVSNKNFMWVWSEDLVNENAMTTYELWLYADCQRSPLYCHSWSLKLKMTLAEESSEQILLHSFFRQIICLGIITICFCSTFATFQDCQFTQHGWVHTENKLGENSYQGWRQVEA